MKNYLDILKTRSNLKNKAAVVSFSKQVEVKPRQVSVDLLGFKVSFLGLKLLGLTFPPLFFPDCANFL